MFQQHYRCYVTGQSQEYEGSYKPARIKEVHFKLNSFLDLLRALIATDLTLIYVCTNIYFRLRVPLGCLIKQTGILNNYLYDTKFVGNTGNQTRDLGLDKFLQTSGSTTRSIPQSCRILKRKKQPYKIRRIRIIHTLELLNADH